MSFGESSVDPSSTPSPVSSLRSKFEQIAAASSSQPSRSLSPKGPPPIPRKRASSNVNLEQRQEFLDKNRIASGPTDALSVPILRSSPSSPDLKGGANTKPAPPPPRGSRTPSPQPPVPSPPVRSCHTSITSESTIDSPVVPVHNKSFSISRRPPPPPPPPPAVKPVVAALENTAGETTTPPVGGVASLRSKFNPATFGNGRPTVPSVKHPAPTRSASVTIIQPPTLPARPSDGKAFPVKVPRSSLPGLSTLTSEPSLSLTLRKASPDKSTSDDISYALSRLPPPPPVPSRGNIDLSAKASKNQEVDWIIEPSPLDTSRRSSESSSSGSMSASSENGVSMPSKPRVPPRPRASINSLLGQQETGSPPPLPPRRNASDELEEQTPAGPPPLPHRPSFDTSTSASSFASLTVAPKHSSRIDHIPPPPTRSIGLKDKLPPARRHSSGESDIESEGERVAAEHPTTSTSRLGRTLEDFPDSSHCSRRPPLLPDYKFAKSRIHVTAHSGIVAVSGPSVVVASHHHLKVYDVSLGDAPVFVIDIKELPIEWRVKDPRVTAMEFRDGEGSERGKYLWCGSKDGHLWEMEVASGTVVRVRNAAHGHAVTQILRYGRSMTTLDEVGKVLVWKDYQDLGSGGHPRIARVAEKQGFMKMFNGLLWTSNGPGNHGAGISSGAQRGPNVRVYDIISPNCAAKIIVPPEALGAVTSGTILPSQPHLVYLGHEGGYVTSWAMAPTALPVGIQDTFDSGRPVPVCVQVVKISATDVLALEGVVDRLWVGSRKGVVSAYDVQTKPWTMTNSWQSHGELPVLKLMVDPFSIEKCQQMHVVSIGRDETLRFWDGLLGTDWVEGEVQNREAEFSTFRDVNVLICSWNVDAQKPEALTGGAENINFLDNVLHSVNSPDIIAFGFQELIDLESRKLTAKTVLLGAQKKNTDGSISEKVSRSYRMWHERLVQAVRIAMPVDDPYMVVHTENLVGLFSCIFVRQRQRHLLRDSMMTTIKLGMGGRYGNKGAIIARFVVDDSSLCFVNCHLAAGQSHTRARNQDVAAILEDAAAFPRSDLSETLPYVGGGDGTMVLDHEICFLSGDLNYRIDQRRDTVISAIKSDNLESLLNHDQLRRQMSNNPGFRLRAFIEAPIAFAPTYKYDRRSSDYDSSEKKRTPAWCDRILYRCRDPSRLQVLHYRRYEANVSDHRPISAAYRVTVKSINSEERAVVKSEIQVLWQERSLRCLSNAREFYSDQQIL